MSSPGQDLRKEREARGLSLKAVADATRITSRYLEAVEADRLDTLPGGFFVKAILRNYARALGLEEDAVLERYRRAGLLPEEEAEPAGKRAPGADEVRRKGRPLAGAAVVALILLSFGVYYLLRSGKAPAPAAETGPSPAGRALLEEAAPAAPAAAPVEEKGVRLQLDFTQDTWLQVFADGRLAVDGIRSAGDSAEVRAESEILIHLGNAGGLTYTLNGKPGKPFGRPGAVVKNIRITPENLGTFLPEGGPGVE